jgi:hypothetical protein
MLWGVLDNNLSYFANISSEEIDFKVWNCEKSSIIWRSRIVQSPDPKKLVIKIDLWSRLTNYRYVICENLSSIWYTVWDALFRKIKDRSTDKHFGFSHELVVFSIFYRKNVKLKSHTPLKVATFVRNSFIRKLWTGKKFPIKSKKKCKSVKMHRPPPLIHSTFAECGVPLPITFFMLPLCISVLICCPIFSRPQILIV